MEAVAKIEIQLHDCALKFPCLWCLTDDQFITKVEEICTTAAIAYKPPVMGRLKILKIIFEY